MKTWKFEAYGESPDFWINFSFMSPFKVLYLEAIFLVNVSVLAQHIFRRIIKSYSKLGCSVTRNRSVLELHPDG